MLRRTYYAFLFVFHYLFLLIWSNILMAGTILSPRMTIQYGVIKVPLIIKSDFGLLLFSNLVSMTPGSLITDIDNDRTTVTVHVIYSKNEQEVSDDVLNIQKKIKRFIP